MKREPFGRYLLHLNARKKVVVFLTCVVLSMAIIVTGVFALAQYTGVIGEIDYVDPYGPTDFEGSGSFFSLPVIPAEDGVSPFSTTSDSIQNPNPFPIVLRASLKEIATRYNVVHSDTPDVPSDWKPIVLDERLYRNTWLNKFLGKKQIPFDSIIWPASFGAKPANLHISYVPDQLGWFDFFVYLDVKDAGGNSIAIQPVDMGNTHPKVHTQDATTISTIWFETTEEPSSKPRYRFYISSEMIQTKIQWAAFAHSDTGDWAVDSSWETSRPTLQQVVKDWSDSLPLVMLKSLVIQDLLYLKAPNLAKAPTSGKWFYNEADGYFYYIGTLKNLESVAAPVNCAAPLCDEDVLNRNFYLKDFRCCLYGDAVEANKDAITTAWGLTFEPGSLGAKILGE